MYMYFLRGGPVSGHLWNKTHDLRRFHAATRLQFSAMFCPSPIFICLLACKTGPVEAVQHAPSMVALPGAHYISLATVPPLSVEIKEREGPVTAGATVTLECRSFGSQPPADITWRLGHSRLPHVSHRVRKSMSFVSLYFVFLFENQSLQNQ